MRMILGQLISYCRLSGTDSTHVFGGGGGGGGEVGGTDGGAGGAGGAGAAIIISHY